MTSSYPFRGSFSLIFQLYYQVLQTNQESIRTAIKSIKVTESGQVVQPVVQEETMDKLMEMMITLQEMLRRKQKPEVDYNQHFAALLAKVEQISVSVLIKISLGNNFCHKLFVE